jgi:hypothetical protein
LIAALPTDQQAGDAEAFAKKLVADKKLASFQAQQVWKGKGKSLTLGEYVIRA